MTILDSKTVGLLPVAEAAPEHMSFRGRIAEWRDSVRAALIPQRRAYQEGLGLSSIAKSDVISSPAAPEAAKQTLTADVAAKKPSGFVTLEDLERECVQEPVTYVVDGFLPAADVHIAVGDSGLGKTPWAYQLGLCVATGRPFLGHPVRQGRVLYFDLENGREEILDVSRSICTHLKVEKFPSEFLVLHDNGNAPELTDAVTDYVPALVIVDTLRAYRPDVEAKNNDTGRFLHEVRKVSRSSKCAVLLLHHIRKSREEFKKSLEDTTTLEWLEQASGARALINQTNTRIAFDRAGKRGDDAAFVMKHFVKLKGESGPSYLERVLNDDGEAIGYRTIVGVDLLGNPEQEAAFPRLPKQFRFREAVGIYGKTDDPTSKWLKKCIALGLVRQVGRGLYERCV